MVEICGFYADVLKAETAVMFEESESLYAWLSGPVKPVLSILPDRMVENKSDPVHLNVLLIKVAYLTNCQNYCQVRLMMLT